MPRNNTVGLGTVTGRHDGKTFSVQMPPAPTIALDEVGDIDSKLNAIAI